MEKKVKIVVFIVFVLLIIFFIFSNMRSAEDAARNVPSDEELKEFSNVSPKSSVNSYEVKDIPDKELANIYYNHFKDLIVNNEEEAYKRLRNNDVTTISQFELLKKDLATNYYGNKVVSYRILRSDGESIYRIVNSNDQTITFYVDEVFKYEIEIA